MRSLYTQDIEGTKPRLTIFTKNYYKQRHEDVLMRSPPQHNQWFVPLPKAPKPDYSRQPARNTIKLISEHTGLSRSMHYESLKKRNNNQPERTRNYSVLSNSGSRLVKNNKITVNEGDNPYFPHRIRQAYDQSMSTRFTGNRSWNNTPSHPTFLSDPRCDYVSKSFRT